MSTTSTTTESHAAAPPAESLHTALASTARPPRPGPLSAAVTFGWRAS